MAVNRSPLLQAAGTYAGGSPGGPRGRPGISASRALCVATRERCALPLTRNRRVLAGVLAAIGSDGELRPTRADREESPACPERLSGPSPTLGLKATAHRLTRGCGGREGPGTTRGPSA